MTELWTIAGIILGWISVEWFGAATRFRAPVSHNLMMAFVGGLVAYTIMTGGRP